MAVDIHIKSSVATVFLQGGALNLLSQVFVRGLNQALRDLENNDAVHVIVIASKQRAFCAGADLTEMRNHAPGMPDFIDDWQVLSTIKKPTIACVMGPCLGGGLEMALMCDLIVASNSAVFGFPEVKLGLLPGGGGTQRIGQRIGKSRACELIMLGESISGQMAHEWGLANRCFSDDVCLIETVQLAERMAQLPKKALQSIKELLIQRDHDTLKEGLKQERAAFYQCLLSDGGRAGIDAFLNKKVK